jgi:hypothetical protein
MAQNTAVDILLKNRQGLIEKRFILNQQIDF